MSKEKLAAALRVLGGMTRKSGSPSWNEEHPLRGWRPVTTRTALEEIRSLCIERGIAPLPGDHERLALYMRFHPAFRSAQSWTIEGEECCVLIFDVPPGSVLVLLPVSLEKVCKIFFMGDLKMLRIGIFLGSLLKLCEAKKRRPVTAF